MTAHGGDLTKLLQEASAVLQQLHDQSIRQRARITEIEAGIQQHKERFKEMYGWADEGASFDRALWGLVGEGDVDDEEDLPDEFDEEYFT